jgi:hypothetical protein
MNRYTHILKNEFTSVHVCFISVPMVRMDIDEIWCMAIKTKNR